GTFELGDTGQTDAAAAERHLQHHLRRRLVRCVIGVQALALATRTRKIFSATTLATVSPVSRGARFDFAGTAVLQWNPL
ncbi:hypothetical protein, partial [Nocardia brasiliensis]|uniref:hypothetical protein n=1 Tax=Nocardia brasiliensis TaxID=37326 RepID=UPI0024585B10